MMFPVFTLPDNTPPGSPRGTSHLLIGIIVIVALICTTVLRLTGSDVPEPVSIATVFGMAYLTGVAVTGRKGDGS